MPFRFMVFLLAYAVAVWVAVLTYRRRWPAFIIPIAAVQPVGMLAVWFAEHVAERLGGPASIVYALAGAYISLILAIAYFIAIMPRRSVVASCAACAYDLAGNISGVCPECGVAIGVKAARRESRRLSRAAVQLPVAAPAHSLATQLAAAPRLERAMLSTTDSPTTMTTPPTAATAAAVQ